MIHNQTPVKRPPTTLTNVYYDKTVVFVNIRRVNNSEITLVTSFFEPNGENINSIGKSFFGEDSRFTYIADGNVYTLQELRKNESD